MWMHACIDPSPVKIEIEEDAGFEKKRNPAHWIRMVRLNRKQKVQVSKLCSSGSAVEGWGSVEVGSSRLTVVQNRVTRGNNVAKKQKFKK